MHFICSQAKECKDQGSLPFFSPFFIYKLQNQYSDIGSNQGKVISKWEEEGTKFSARYFVLD